MEIKKLQSKADKLAKLRDKLAKLDAAYEAKAAVIKDERDRLQQELLDDMAREQIASLRVVNGDMYTRAVRKGIIIADEVFARKWALDNNAYSIDRRRVAEVLGKADILPPGFQKTEVAYISIRKNKDDKSN